ncbi:MAG: hypothetical protein R6W94_12030 [Spirochaetia bacterium]
MSARIAPAAGAVFLVSALVLGLQIAFIRVLSLDTYHHFTYLVISTALLGFGASGTVLSVARRWITRRFAGVSAAILVLLVVSAVYAYRVAVVLRPDMQYVLYSFAEVMKLWAHTLVLFLPFFFGGAFVGLALSTFYRQVGAIYGANMIGSGLGGVGGVLLAFLVVPYRMPAVIAILGVAALFLWVLAWPEYRSGRGRIIAGAALAATTVAALVGLLLPVDSSVDQYKPMAHAQRLARQGDARYVDGAFGPRAQIDVFDVPSMHHTLFAAPEAPSPPPQLSLFLDGAHAGGVFLADEAAEAEVVRHTAQSLAYRLVERPRVLLLGEQTGVNVWLALAHGAREVVVVQPNPQIRRVLADTDGGAVFRHPAVEVVHTEPRHFLAAGDGGAAGGAGAGSAGGAFDIIHLAEVEGMPAGSGGLASMREDYLLTVEAVRAAVDRLSAEGLLTVTRGMQTPPRDNVRLFALFAEAMRGTGDHDPDSRLLQARNYLAVTTIAAARPLDPERVAAFRKVAAELSMDADYHPGISPGDLTDRNRVPGPEDSPGSYYYHAAQRILGGPAERESFYEEWVYNVRPPTDESPYFHSFFRWGSLGTYIESYGRSWFQRLELGYAVVFVTFLQVLIAALVLVLAPVLVVRRRGGIGGGRVGWTVLHFTAIGLGFLFVEMLHIQRFTRFLGDPIYATAAVLTAILVFSGTGSYLQGRLRMSPGRRIRLGGFAVAVLALVYYLVLDPVLGLAVDANEPLRFVVSLVLLFPISFALGWLMPAGLEIAGNRSEDLIPLAWAVNGVASVAATPLSVMIATGGGFLAVSLLAAGCYLLVAVAAPRARQSAL